MVDFNITRTPREVIDVTGNKVEASFAPDAGSNIAIVYIEPNAGNDATILTKLNEIQALSKTFAKKIWPVEALPDKSARVEVRVIVRDNVEV